MHRTMLRTCAKAAELALFLTACSNGDSPADAGDAMTVPDTTVMDVAKDTYVDPVAVCKAEAMRVAGYCSGARKCFFKSYADLCVLERNDIITKAMMCFSDCETFNAPGPADTCVRGVSTNAQTASATAARTAYCAKCPNDPPCTGATPFMIPFEHLSDSRNDQTAMCAAAAVDCIGAQACLLTEFPDLFACYGSASDGGSDAGLDAPMEAGSAWSSPTCDGTVGAMEYGGAKNQFTTKGGQTWSMAWDMTNLYVALESANVSEAVVLYAGWANGGLKSGQVYDSTAPGTMTFGANAVLYAKNNYNEVRQVSGMAWGNPNANALKFCGQNTTREIVVSWQMLGSNGIPSAFRWVAYATSGSGFVYAQIPETLPGGNIGTNATFPNNYFVSSTNNGTGSFPFDTIE